MTKWLCDVESRGQLAFNTGCIKSHANADKYARKTYRSVIEQECFVAGWNTAFWGNQRDLKLELTGKVLTP